MPALGAVSLRASGTANILGVSELSCATSGPVLIRWWSGEADGVRRGACVQKRSAPATGCGDTHSCLWRGLPAGRARTAARGLLRRNQPWRLAGRSVTLSLFAASQDVGGMCCVSPGPCGASRDVTAPDATRAPHGGGDVARSVAIAGNRLWEHQ